jgi:transposase
VDVVKLPTANHGVVLLPRCWVVERSFAWMARFWRLAHDDARLAETLAGVHFVAVAILLVHRFVTFMAQSA